MKKNYLKPEVEIFAIQQGLSFLEYFSGNGDVNQFEDGGELIDVSDVSDADL